MTFATSNSITEAAAGTGATYFYRLNSVYDPDATGVGTTATGYATWSALFLNYKVRKVTVRLQATQAVASAGAMANVLLAAVPNQAVVPTNKQTWKMIRGATFKTIAPTANGGKNICSFVESYDNAWVAEVTPGQYENDLAWSGAVGSNPLRMNYLMVAGDTVGSTTPGIMTYNIQITYLVEWFNPVPIQ